MSMYSTDKSYNFNIAAISVYSTFFGTKKRKQTQNANFTRVSKCSRSSLLHVLTYSYNVIFSEAQLIIIMSLKVE